MLPSRMRTSFGKILRIFSLLLAVLGLVIAPVLNAGLVQCADAHGNVAIERAHGAAGCHSHQSSHIDRDDHDSGVELTCAPVGCTDKPIAIGIAADVQKSQSLGRAMMLTSAWRQVEDLLTQGGLRASRDVEHRVSHLPGRSISCIVLLI